MTLLRRLRAWFDHPEFPDPSEPHRLQRRERLIAAMCGTWDHSYGIMPAAHAKALHHRMSQIYDNDIAPEFEALEQEFALNHAAYGSWTLP
jgi:uncharacterized protein YcaQ